ncbi:MAG: hypothetical protein ABUT20_36170 [Bacteroidota bacterium]
MNNIFSVRRFARLFYKHSTENYKSYGMAIVVLLGIMILGAAFMVYLVDMPLDENVQSVLFMAILLLSGTIFTSTVFADLGDARKSIPWLTLPATHFEKYMVAWIYTVLIFLLIYTSAFYAVLVVAVHVRSFPGYTPRILNIFRSPVIQVFLLYAFLHGVAFWGAIFFKKLHFIKTAFAFFILFGLLVGFNKIIFSIMFGSNAATTPPFGSARLYEKGGYTDIGISRMTQGNIMFGLLVLLAILFWFAAFYRLKEKQV